MIFKNKWLFAFLLGLSLSACAQKKTVLLTVKYTQPYCGGARPTPEMVKAASEPKVYANKILVFISDKGKADSAKTNEKGVLKLKLAMGTYRVYESWRYYKQAPGTDRISLYDGSCLQSEWQKESHKIVVGSKTSTATEINAIIEFCAHNRPCLKEENIQRPE